MRLLSIGVASSRFIHECCTERNLRSVQADIGVKNGKIAGIGKAGNPDIMNGVTPGMVVGSCTEVR